ncbi:MAG TPA: hypothetical protein VJH03_05645 [Blastocatellia bacterium]|nr:hypothetical protein [Blastocatellia bacterium]
MKRALLFVGLLATLPATMMAQETPKAEVFGGYSSLRVDGGGNLHGWNASVAANLNRWFGIATDFSGHYGSESARASLPGVGFFRVDADANSHSFAAGPVFSYRKNEGITPFAHVLIGVARVHVRASADVSVPGGTEHVELSASDTGFVAVFGGGLDVKLSKRLALRTVQADYALSRLGGFTQNNFRLSAGLVFRFGST